MKVCSSSVRFTVFKRSLTLELSPAAYHWALHIRASLWKRYILGLHLIQRLTEQCMKKWLESISRISQVKDWNFRYDKTSREFMPRYPLWPPLERWDIKYHFSKIIIRLIFNSSWSIICLNVGWEFEERHSPLSLKSDLVSMKVWKRRGNGANTC